MSLPLGLVVGTNLLLFLYRVREEMIPIIRTLINKHKSVSSPLVTIVIILNYHELQCENKVLSVDYPFPRTATYNPTILLLPI